MIIGLTFILLACLYFVTISTGRIGFSANSPTRESDPQYFWLQLSFTMYILCLAANFQAADTGATKFLQAVQHLGFTLGVMGFGIFGPAYAMNAELKGEIRGTFGVQTKDDKWFKNTVKWYQSNGMICLLIGSISALAFVTGFWFPLFVSVG